MWFTLVMFSMTRAAEAALEGAVDAVTACDLNERLHSLITETWQANLGRYEPDELGDDPRRWATPAPGT